jgi:pimeloyl-ACP methyl ester carboxylesterase
VARHQEAAFRLDWPTAESLRGVDVPVLVFHGRLDRVLPIAHAEALGALMPESSVTVVDGMGHLPRQADWAMIAGRIVTELT